MRRAGSGPLLAWALVAPALACQPTPRAQPALPSEHGPGQRDGAPPSTVDAGPAATSGIDAASLEGPCAAAGCRLFDSAEQALERVLQDRPRVLGIGEAHAQKGTEHVATATRRFTRDLLPLLEGRASDLVLELLVAEGRCGRREQQVAERQRPVTEGQAEQNQNEFVTLATEAKARAVTPHVLRPSCEQYGQIVQAGANAVVAMLELIAELTTQTVEALLARRSAEQIIVTYGGAMHNDVRPRAGREAFSFGLALSARTGGRYVELDLIVPEYIQDTEVWHSLPWFEQYDRDRLGAWTVLFNPAPAVYVLVFPASR